MATAKRKKISALPPSIKGKSAMDKLLDAMRDVIDEGARGMTAQELEESEKKFNAALDRAAAARKRRRETASFALGCVDPQASTPAESTREKGRRHRCPDLGTRNVRQDI